MTDQNPRAVVGDNRAPLAAQMVTDQMAAEYAALTDNITALLDRARSLPADITDDLEMGTYARLIKDLRDTAARIEAFRTAEKEPFLRSGQAVDAFFFGWADKVARRDRKARPGAADVLQGRLDDYQQRKLLAEQARRRAEAEEAARAQRERIEAEEARLAAERARKPETVEAKTAVADAASAAAVTSGIDAQIATGRAEEAHVATLARPADIVRTRVDEGPLVTMAQEGYAEIIDAALLDKDVLWPFISEDAKAKALRSWAKTTGHRTQMEGAAIGKRNKSVIR